jgi:hypothetical protein
MPGRGKRRLILKKIAQKKLLKVEIIHAMHAERSARNDPPNFLETLRVLMVETSAFLKDAHSDIGGVFYYFFL